MVRLGVINLASNATEPSLVELQIKNFIKHPAYDIYKNNDIALIELGKSVTFDKKFLRPACLQQQEYQGITWYQKYEIGSPLDLFAV